MSDTNKTEVETDAVCAGAYRGQIKNTLTHSFHVASTTLRTLCGQIEVDNLAGDPALTHTVPTCPRCAKKDPRF